MSDLQVLTLSKGVPAQYADLNLLTSNNGRFVDGPVFVSGIDKAVQDLIRGLLTVKGTNALSPNYGTFISSLINAPNLPQINSQLLEQIRFLLGYLNSFNVGQPDSERITDIISIQSKQETRSISLQITLKTADNAVSTVVIS